ARYGLSDAMAARAVPLAGEERAAASDVTSLDRGDVHRVHVADIGNDARHLGVVEREGRHASGRPGSDDAVQVAIGEGCLEDARPEVDAANRVALGTVAGHTACRIE